MKNLVNKIFFIFLMAIAINYIAKFAYYVTDIPRIKLASSLLINFWPYILYTQLIFIIVFTKRIRLQRVKVMSIVVGILITLFVVILIQNNLESYFTDKTISMIPHNKGLIIIASIFSIALSLFTIIVSVTYFFKIKEKYLKRQTVLVISGLVIQLLTSEILEGFFPALLHINLQEYSILPRIIAIIIFGHAIRRYNLFEISPTTAINDILNTMPDGLLLIDAQFNIVFANPSASQISGYTEKELKNNSFFKILQRDKIFFQRLHEDLKINPQKNIDLVLKKKDGKILNVSIAVSSLVNKNNKDLRGYAYLIRDMSEKIELMEKNQSLQEQLFQSQKLEAIGQLAGGISHDFNNLIGAISILAEDLIDEFGNKDSYIKGGMNNILLATEQAKNLTEKLLAFARKGKFKLTEINMHEAIENVIKIICRTLDKRIMIEKKLEAKRSFINGDIHQIENAILNIVLNSSDAMPEGGMITFMTKNMNQKELESHYLYPLDKDKQYILVQINDTGKGMPKNICDRCFEPFFTTKPTGKGTGLGLASVFGTIKNHEGFIDIQSTVDMGTTVTILFPAIKIIKKDTQEEIVRNNTIKKQLNVLLVDDQELIINACKKTLVKMNFKVAGFLRPIEAIEYYKLNYQDIDVILLDLMMPDISGHDCFIKLKEINPLLKVIIMTGFAQDGEATKLLELGACAYLQKPFRKSQLIEAFEKTMQRQIQE